VGGLRLGVPTNAFYRFGRQEAVSVFERGRRSLFDLGLIPMPVELPFAEQTNELSKLIIDVELWAYHGQLRDREGLYGRDFLKKSLPGLDVRAVAYARAKDTQAEIRHAWLRVFEQVDLLVLPANVAGAPPHGITMIEVSGHDYEVPMVTSRYNRASNITGFPALVLPCGATPTGLPIGIQLVGPPLSEGRLFAVAYALEQHLGNLPTPWGIEPRDDGGYRESPS
jgi:aspartyl-tRNA(Asn)/glutamyl-tRNA(Gln) amidotransferase subunit A